MATSVTMPTTIVMPIMAEMLSSMPVSHNAMNTAGMASMGIATMASAMANRSYRNISSTKTSIKAATITTASPLKAACCSA